MTFDETVEKIYLLSKFNKKYGLDGIKHLLSLMGNPQNDLKIVHIAGTNGKGSISTMIAGVLTESSLKTGLYTSPFVCDFRERFMIDFKMIEKDTFCELADEIFDTINANNVEITSFEFITVLAYIWFKRENCDVVVLETGMGGRLDATNVFDESLVSVISSISYDHMDMLGNTLPKIAYEKAGIIKKNGNVVIYPKQDNNALQVLLDKAKEQNANAVIPDLNKLKILGKEDLKLIISYDGLAVKLPLSGKYQIYNTLCVLETIKILKSTFNITASDTVNGIEKIKLPSRLEVISNHPLTILDGAHNENAFEMLADFIKQFLANRKIYCIIGILADKQPEKMVEKIAHLCEKFYTVSIDNDRTLNSSDMLKIVQKFTTNTIECKEGIAKAFEIATSDAKKYNGVILVCGSLFLAKDLKDYLKNKTKEGK